MSADIELGPTCEEVEDSLSAYALGVLDPDEVVAIEEHIAGCESCQRQLMIEFHTVDSLALTVAPVEPSPDVRTRLMNAAAAVPTAATPAPTSLDAARAVKRRAGIARWLLPAVSVAAALLLIGIGVLGVMLERAIDERDESKSVAQLLSTYVSSGGQVVTLQTQPASIYNQSYEGQGSLLIAPGMEPVVVVAECPESGDHLTYWVWFEREGERTGAGKLTVGDDGSGWLTVDPALPIGEFDSIGVTVVVGDEGRWDVLLAPLDSNVSEG